MGYITDTRALVFGLLVRCPFDEAQGECPLESFRSSDLRDIKQLAFEEMNEELAVSIVEYHRNCAYIRDNPLLPRDRIPVSDGKSS